MKNFFELATPYPETKKQVRDSAVTTVLAAIGIIVSSTLIIGLSFTEVFQKNAEAPELLLILTIIIVTMFTPIGTILLIKWLICRSIYNSVMETYKQALYKIETDVHINYVQQEFEEKVSKDLWESFIKQCHRTSRCWLTWHETVDNQTAMILKKNIIQIAHRLSAQTFLTTESYLKKDFEHELDKLRDLAEACIEKAKEKTPPPATAAE